MCTYNYSITAHSGNLYVYFVDEDGKDVGVVLSKQNAAELGVDIINYLKTVQP